MRPNTISKIESKIPALVKNASKMTHQSVRIYVGSKDRVLQANQEIAVAIKKAGGDVALTVYDGVGHVCWPAVYENPKFYQWLLTQKRDRSGPSSL